ncbi:hypothetical protein Tco_0242261 [Tanacetum coccineum]
MILSGADNRPPMLDKDMYDSWKSRMELYMQNIEHIRMILESVEHGPLIWPTFEENGVTKTKKYVELFAKDLWERVQLPMQVNTKFLNSLPLEWSKFVTDVKLVKDLHTTNFDQLHAYLEQHELHANEVRLLRERNQDPLAFVFFRDDLIACLNKADGFLTAVASSRFPSTNNQLRTSSNPRNHATIQDGMVTVQQLGKTRQGLLNATTVKVKDIWLGNACSLSDQGMQHDQGFQTVQSIQTIIPKNVSFQTEDLDTYDSDCDDISNAKAVLMANISITTHNFHLFLDLAKPRKEKKGLQAVLKPRFKKNKGA